MVAPVPPRKREPLHFGRREIIVLVIGAVATVAAALVLLESTVTDKRVIFGVPAAVAALFILLAFYRDRNYGEPFEGRFIRIYRFYKSDRYLVKGVPGRRIVIKNSTEVRLCWGKITELLAEGETHVIVNSRKEFLAVMIPFKEYNKTIRGLLSDKESDGDD